MGQLIKIRVENKEVLANLSRLFHEDKYIK